MLGSSIGQGVRLVRRPRGRRRTWACLAALLCLLTTSCLQEPVPRERTQVDLTPSAASKCRELLSVQEAEALAGIPLNVGRFFRLPNLLLGCRWEALDDSASTVQAVSMSAGSWSRIAPGYWNALLSSDESSRYPGLRARLRASLRILQQRGSSLSDAEACRAFRELASMWMGQPTSLSLAYVPDEGRLGALSGQVCTGEVYSLVQLSTPDLTVSPRLEKRLLIALKQVHPAPLPPLPVPPDR